MALTPYATSHETARLAASMRDAVAEEGCELLWIIAARSRYRNIVPELFQVVYRLPRRGCAMSMRTERRTCYATWTGEAFRVVPAAELAAVPEDARRTDARVQAALGELRHAVRELDLTQMPAGPLTASLARVARRVAILGNGSYSREWLADLEPEES